MISPGRFFAVNELKALAAHVLVHYDIKFRDSSLLPGEVPKDMWLGIICIPDSKAEILFRRRNSVKT